MADSMETLPPPAPDTTMVVGTSKWSQSFACGSTKSLCADIFPPNFLDFQIPATRCDEVLPSACRRSDGRQDPNEFLTAFPTVPLEDAAKPLSFGGRIKRSTSPELDRPVPTLPLQTTPMQTLAPSRQALLPAHPSGRLHSSDPPPLPSLGDGSPRRKGGISGLATACLKCDYRELDTQLVFSTQPGVADEVRPRADTVAEMATMRVVPPLDMASMPTMPLNAGKASAGKGRPELAPELTGHEAAKGSAKPAARGPGAKLRDRVDGKWRTAMGGRATIDGERVSWPYGVSARVRYMGDSEVAIDMQGHTMLGALSNQDELIWIDGEVWTRSESEAPPRCPAGHPLELFETDEDGWECSACETSQEAKRKMMGCRKCDYDLCGHCMVKAPPGGHMPPRLVGGPSRVGTGRVPRTQEASFRSASCPPGPRGGGGDSSPPLPAEDRSARMPPSRSTMLMRRHSMSELPSADASSVTATLGVRGRQINALTTVPSFTMPDAGPTPPQGPGAGMQATGSAAPPGGKGTGPGMQFAGSAAAPPPGGKGFGPEGAQAPGSAAPPPGGKGFGPEGAQAPGSAAPLPGGKAQAPGAGMQAPASATTAGGKGPGPATQAHGSEAPPGGKGPGAPGSAPPPGPGPQGPGLGPQAPGAPASAPPPGPGPQGGPGSLHAGLQGGQTESPGGKGGPAAGGKAASPGPPATTQPGSSAGEKAAAPGTQGGPPPGGKAPGPGTQGGPPQQQAGGKAPGPGAQGGPPPGGKAPGPGTQGGPPPGGKAPGSGTQGGPPPGGKAPGPGTQGGPPPGGKGYGPGGTPQGGAPPAGGKAPGPGPQGGPGSMHAGMKGGTPPAGAKDPGPGTQAGPGSMHAGMKGGTPPAGKGGTPPAGKGGTPPAGKGGTPPAGGKAPGPGMQTGPPPGGKGSTPGTQGGPPGKGPGPGPQGGPPGAKTPPAGMQKAPPGQGGKAPLPGGMMKSPGPAGPGGKAPPPGGAQKAPPGAKTPPAGGMKAPPGAKGGPPPGMQKASAPGAMPPKQMQKAPPPGAKAPAKGAPPKAGYR
eukprot:TRINITY_DN6251_c0_g1_i1.p1 TRINITY_DN6251_c0_g1~~TRINITY_DN6251_c0_g1_i1.p1  ORF type:complete len:1044 (+),score=207.15 TRINITY_DN6251_c0_g1_i1:157-3288(+)